MHPRIPQPREEDIEEASIAENVDSKTSPQEKGWQSPGEGTRPGLGAWLLVRQQLHREGALGRNIVSVLPGQRLLLMAAEHDGSCP
jgi:hypothetical protein